MEWLNYHHLQYFWMTAREGGVSRASEKLHLSQPTISAQISSSSACSVSGCSIVTAAASS